MSHRTIAAAVAALLTGLAAPVGAGSPPAAWIPTLAQDDIFKIDAAAFADGTGLVATGPFTTRGVSDVTDRRALYRTGDGGLTWSRAATGVPGDLQRVAFATPTAWWGVAGRSDSVVRTTDAGARWSQVSLPGGLSSVYAISAVGSTVALGGRVRATTSGPSCGGDVADGIAWSTDSGATWTEHRFPAYHSKHAAWVSDLHVADPRTGVALVWADVPDCSGTVGTGVDVYLTRDGGATWSRVARSRVDDPRSARVQDASVTAAGLLSVAWSDGTVSVSEDDGATFRRVTLRRYDNDRSSGMDAVLNVAFSGSTGYAVQASGAVWRSTDAGTTWLPDGQVSPVLWDAVLPFDADRAIAVRPGAVFARVAP